jgi:hypothetical protein
MMKITKPATVTRAFQFAATRAAARIVVMAAKVLSRISTSINYSNGKAARSGGGRPLYRAKV